MFIKSIHIKNFRNIKEEEVFFSSRTNLVSGENGQGKTNLLEAIYILSMGKSFRTQRDEEMIRFGKEAFRVDGVFEKDGEELRVGMRLSAREKDFFINGAQKKKNADLLEQVYAVVFSPEDLKIVKDEPEKRRKFMNRELFQLKPLFFTELNKYRRALKNRNLLLKEDFPDENLLAVYDTYLASSGAKIMKERDAFCRKISEISADICRKISAGKEELEVKYEPNIACEPSDAEMEKEILRILRDTREKDLRLRSTSRGPHKDDVSIRANDVDLRHFGSQGQQRTAALSLKLAEVELIEKEAGESPLILLDDVFSELDETRRQYITRAFSEKQIFISAADLTATADSLFPGAQILQVSDGHIY